MSLLVCPECGNEARMLFTPDKPDGEGWTYIYDGMPPYELLMVEVWSKRHGIYNIPTGNMLNDSGFGVSDIRYWRKKND